MRLPTAMAAAAVATVLGATSAMGALLVNGSVLAPYPNTWLPALLPNQVAFLSSSVTDDEGDFSATVVSTVHNLVPLGLNPLPNPGLTFTYTMSNVADGGDPNEALIVFGINLGSSSCGTFDADSVFVLGGANVPAGAVYKNCVLAFVWDQADQILEGESSVRLVIHTSLKQFVEGNGGVIDGSSEDVKVLIPVPEPTTYAGLFALGLAGFAAYRRLRA